MSYKIEIGDVSTPDQVIDSDTLNQVDVAKPHTALADFDVDIPFSRSIKNHALKPIRIYADRSVIFRGYLKDFSWNQKQGTTRLNGPGIGDDLRDSAIEQTFQTKATHEAIKDVWSLTGFDATVADPVINRIVDSKTILDASTQSELSSAIASIPSTSPLNITSNGRVQLLQSNFVIEAENPSTVSVPTISRSDFSDGGGLSFNSDTDAQDYTIDIPYDIPDDDLNVYLRAEEITAGDFTTLEIYDSNGNQLSGGISPPSNLGWVSAGLASGSQDNFSGTTTLTLQPNQKISGTYGETEVDVVSFPDTRFNYFFDNTLNTSSGNLDGPELFPQAKTVILNQISTDNNVIEISMTTGGWDDTSNSQSVAVSFDGGSSYTTANNQTTVTATDTDNVGKTVDSRFTLSRYGSARSETPRFGYKGQSLSSINLTYDGTNLSVIQDNTFRGSPLSIQQDLHNKADYRFVIDHAARDGNGDLTKRVESFETTKKTKPKNWTVVNRNASLSFQRYANEVTVYGALESGTRPKAVVEDSDEVNQFGREPYFEILPDVTSVKQAKSAATDILRSKVRERAQKGSIEALPTDALPGYSYPVDWFADGNTTETPLEKVQFQEGTDTLRATLEFKRPDDVTTTVIEQGRAIDQTRSGI